MSAPAALAGSDALELRLEGPPRLGLGATRLTIMALAALFAGFQLWVTLESPLSAITLRSVHAAFLVALGALVFTAAGSPREGRAGPFDVLLVLLAMGCGVYFWLHADGFSQRVGWPLPADIVVGCVFIALVFETARRATGNALPLICFVVLLWGGFGQHLPSPLNHRGYDTEQLVAQLVLGTEGLFGTAAAVSATYIFLFVLFSAFMGQSGILTLFHDIALRLVGHLRSGPAQACIVSSALTGTVSGSGIANVVSSGQVTIPLMRRYGFSPNFAAAVEAASSMGGQIMPPVMGAVAFVMADMLDKPYAEIALAALLPALLYFAGISWIAYLEARRLGLGTARREPVRIAGRWFLLLPIAVIMALLFLGYTPVYAAMGALLFTMVMILTEAPAARLAGHRSMPLRLGFMGLALAAVLAAGTGPLLWLVAGLALANLATCQGRGVLRRCWHSLFNGTVGAVAVGLTCVLVGVIDGVLGLTGVTLELTGWIMAGGAGLLWLSLVLLAFTCIVLGLGLPTLPAYIICASIAVPPLLALGVAPFQTHMFVFYFSVLAQLTPPVALAAVAAMPFAGPTASVLAIGWIATALGLSGFLVPFVFVYSPELLLGSGTVLETAAALLRVVLAVGLSGLAFVGFLHGKLAWSQRGLLALAALLLVFTRPEASLAGLTLGGGVILFHQMAHRRRLRAA